jgi:RHS repeat-associated protein
LQADGATYFFVKNLQGDVTKVVDDNGTIVAEYAYDAWRAVISSSGSMSEINPIRYRGYYFDVETGLYYCQQRYYNPSWGRWVSADVLAVVGNVNGCNIYQYCYNNPVSRIDEQGEKSTTIIQNPSGFLPTQLLTLLHSIKMAEPYTSKVKDGNLDGTYYEMTFEWNNKPRVIHMVTYSYSNDSWWMTNRVDVVAFGATVDDWNALRLLVGKKFAAYGIADITSAVASVAIPAIAKWLALDLALGPAGAAAATLEVLTGVAMFLIQTSFSDLDEDINGHGYNPNDIFILNFSVTRLVSFIFQESYPTLEDSYTAIVNFVNAFTALPYAFTR